MKPLHQMLFAAGLVLLGAITWRVLTLPKPQAGWLTVEAPDRAAPAETITLRVTLSQPDPNLQLVADLHGWTRRNQPLGAIARHRPRPVVPANPTMDFSLPVPVLPNLAEVRAVIYLTPTGRWKDYVKVVMSDAIPVKPSTPPVPPKLKMLSAHEFGPDPVIPRLESTLLRRMIVGLWLAVAIVLGLQLRRTRPALAAASGPRIKAPTLALIIACLAAVLSETIGAEQSVGDFARQFALRHGLYEERHLPQQIAVLVAVVGVVALIVLIIVRARRRRLVCGLLVYAVIAVVATLSLHETDALLYATILGQPVEQLAKLIAVGLSLWGLRSQSQRSAIA